MAIRSGPYEIGGRVHALAGADPVGSLRRRRPMVPLTVAHLSFSVGGRPRVVVAEVLIINRDLIDVVQGPHDPAPQAPGDLPVTDSP